MRNTTATTARTGNMYTVLLQGSEFCRSKETLIIISLQGFDSQYSTQ